jgi:hypothetical protein
MKKDGRMYRADRHESIIKENKLYGYPLYPDSDYIFVKSHEEKSVNPENISNSQEINKNNEPENRYKQDSNKDVSGSDLDVPGSELDDKQEIVGSEDEENNYYSLGGDNHSNLDENKE